MAAPEVTAYLPHLVVLLALARAARRLPPGRLLAALMLGIAYGVTQFAGLAQIQRIADPRSLGTATATYQMLSYIGFAFPFLMALASSRGHLSPPDLLLMLLGVAAIAAIWLATAGSRLMTDEGGDRG
jgi:hypothetical protein